MTRGPAVPEALRPVLAALAGDIPVGLDASAWRAACAAAETHGFLPLLAQALGRAGWAGVPEDARAAITASAAATAAKNLLLGRELHAVLARARQAGLPLVPLRGIALAEQLHGSPALRPTGDIDLLAARADLPRLRELLRALGFHDVEPRRGFAEAFEYTDEFFKPSVGGRGTLIAEPRWTLAYPPFADRLTFAEAQPRCRPAVVAGEPCLRLGPDDLLLHLCLHWLHHLPRSPLLWLYELDLLIRTTPLSWAACAATAREAGVSPLLRAALDQARDAFGTPIPPPAWQALQSAPRGARQRAVVTLLTQLTGLRGRERLAVLVGAGGLRAKLRYAAGFLLPAPQFIREQYAVSGWRQVAGVYVRRLAGLVWDGLRGAWRLAAAMAGGRGPSP